MTSEHQDKLLQDCRNVQQLLNIERDYDSAFTEESKLET